jgi:hypothetical protein
MSDTAKDQAIAQCSSIVEMIAALDCDYERLAELREERDAFAEEYRDVFGDVAFEWRAQNPDSAIELADLEDAAGDCIDEDDARQHIEGDALSVEIRSDWGSPGEDMQAGEFRILLCTGGPHVEIVGDLDEYKQPSRPRILYKDWGESGELFDFDHDTVTRYCSVFYFGE